MKRTGIATLPLHHGKAPAWLFQRMTELSRSIVTAIVSEFGPSGFLKRVSDPFWFQSFGCVLAFDWHSSGLTTTVTGALKEAIKGLEKDLGLFIAGGKGLTARKTPGQIEAIAERFPVNPYPLIYASRLSAKVDSVAIQDGYQLYHHVMLFTYNNEWAVIQQGMDPATKTARRYHWLGERVRDFVVEPHEAICCDRRGRVLNMVASESDRARKTVTEIAKTKPEHLLRELNRIKRLDLTSRHVVTASDIDPKRFYSIMLKTYERRPEHFESLLGIEGIGPKTMRALSLISELIYGIPPSYRDPARFSFAHGGKDGTPFPVDRKTYDRSIDIIRKAIMSARVGRKDKMEAIKRLSAFYAAHRA